MSDLFDNLRDRSIRSELEQAIRTRGVRVEERLALLQTLSEEDAASRVDARVDELEGRMRESSHRVVQALRGNRS